MRELEIALPQWPIDLIREPQLEIEDILAVQSLMMGYLRKRARRPRTDQETKSHYLTMLDYSNEADDPDEMYDGSIDTYMSCKVQKRDYNQWRMLVSFLEVANVRELNQTNTREMYRFDWLNNGNRQAWYTSVTKQRQEEGLYVQVNATHPITSDECLRLQDRMLEVSEAVNPITIDSIMVPRLDGQS